jgi:hypothetical protein
MTIAYPAIRPTDLTLTLGNYPIAAHGWQGVWEAPEIAGSLLVDPRLELRYKNVTTADAVAFLVSWRSSGSGFIKLNSPLPAEVVAGVVNATLAAWIRQPTGLVWTWAERPDHQAVKAKRATVNVRLIAELR